VKGTVVVAFDEAVTAASRIVPRTTELGYHGGGWVHILLMLFFRLARPRAALPLLLAVAACGPRQPSLPTVAEVQQRFVQAIGGEAAIMRPRSITLRGRNELYGAHGKRIQLFVLLYIAPFKRLEIDTLPHRGRFETGYDGKIAWALSPGTKPQIIAGHDTISIRRDADLYYWAHIPQYFKSMSVVGIETFAGHRCYHLRGITLWSNENNQYYDVRTGLLTGYRFHQWVAGTPAAAETRQVFERYRSFEGLAFPTRTTNFSDNRLTSVGRLISVQYDKVPPSIFDPPPAVRAMLKR
jgi:hypothetical protein